MYYWLTRTEDDDERWEAELLVGLGERLEHEYDDMSFWEICHRLGLPAGKEREILLGE
jgi:hypothetical protein